MKKTGFIVLGLALVVSTGLFWVQSKAPESKKVESLACADIAESCGNAEFMVRFKEKPQVMKPLHLELVSVNPSMPIQSIYANFAMKGMEMGFNRYRLIQTGQDQWQAEVTLPVCMQGRSDWEMLLEIETVKAKARFLVPFSAVPK